MARHKTQGVPKTRLQNNSASGEEFNEPVPILPIFSARFFFKLTWVGRLKVRRGKVSLPFLTDNQLYFPNLEKENLACWLVCTLGERKVSHLGCISDSKDPSALLNQHCWISSQCYILKNWIASNFHSLATTICGKIFIELYLRAWMDINSSQNMLSVHPRKIIHFWRICTFDKPSVNKLILFYRKNLNNHT